MQKNPVSESGIFTPRVILAFTLCSIGVSLAMLGFAASPPAGARPATMSHANQRVATAKIAPWVLGQTANGNQAEFLIVLADQADLKGAEALKTKEEKGRYVRDALWNKAQAAQAPLLQWLRDHNVEHRSYYIVNLIWAKGSIEIAQALAARPDVLRIEGNPQIRNIPDPLPTAASPLRPESPTSIEPGITYTRAPEVWALGYTGQGIVLAGADTGYRWDHTALKNKYRGWNGTVASHDYNWHDSIHSGGGSCGPNSTQPCDDSGHGTHTMGTAVGDDGGANQIGMAPGAKWIGCRNMNVGVGAPNTYIECMEFFLAPYPLNGTPSQGDPSKAPHITTNSWSCPSDEGCSADSLQAAVEAQRAAGIMMVVAAGNGGPACSTVQDPPGIYDAAYSIGALTTGSDAIASFSSRGPVVADMSLRLKPDLSAPGTNTRSCTPGSTTSYGSLSGTSMATPHVAGAVALLWSAQPLLRHDVSLTESILNQTAVHITGSTCDLPTATPNNTFGNGRLDIKAAADRALTPPQLTAVVSRKTHGNGAGTFDINLPVNLATTGIECRAPFDSSVGSVEYKLVFTFADALSSVGSVGASATGTTQPGTSNGAVDSNDAHNYIVNLSALPNAQYITVTLNNVHDVTNHLGNISVTFGLLVGDINASGRVDSGDVFLARQQSLQDANASNFRGDLNSSGRIDSGDVFIARQESLSALP